MMALITNWPRPFIRGLMLDIMSLIRTAVALLVVFFSCGYQCLWVLPQALIFNLHVFRWYFTECVNGVFMWSKQAVFLQHLKLGWRFGTRYSFLVLILVSLVGYGFWFLHFLDIFYTMLIVMKNDLPTMLHFILNFLAIRNLPDLYTSDTICLQVEFTSLQQEQVLLQLQITIKFHMKQYVSSA